MGFTRDLKNPGALVLIPEEAQNIRTIFKTFLKIGNLRQTCLFLNQHDTQLKNLVTRISELPTGIKAEPFYEKIESLQTKIAGLQKSKDETFAEKLKHQIRGEIDQPELKARVMRAIDRLEQASKEKLRELFSNVIQFAEFHPTKLRLGVSAPLMASMHTKNKREVAREGCSPIFHFQSSYG